MYKLYKITNVCNGKTYIGITQLSLQARLAQHIRNSLNPKYPLHRSMQNYGIENFIINLIYEHHNREVISNLEEPLILLSNSRKNGYNVALGGYGGNLGAAANEKRRTTLMNRLPEEKLRLATLQRHRQTGKTKDNDAGRLSQSQKVNGNQFAAGYTHSEDTKKRMSEAHIGKIVSGNTRQKMAESAIINNNASRFNGRRASCICCHKDWDIGNFTKHIQKDIK